MTRRLTAAEGAPRCPSARNTLGQIARRDQLMLPSQQPTSTLVEAVSAASPTQMARAETDSTGPTTSEETVSSEWLAAEEGSGGAAGGCVDERETQ